MLMSTLSANGRAGAIRQQICRFARSRLVVAATVMVSACNVAATDAQRAAAHCERAMRVAAQAPEAVRTSVERTNNRLAATVNYTQSTATGDVPGQAKCVYSSGELIEFSQGHILLTKKLDLDELQARIDGNYVAPPEQPHAH